jgi:uncharacterized membrane protein
MVKERRSMRLAFGGGMRSENKIHSEWRTMDGRMAGANEEKCAPTAETRENDCAHSRILGAYRVRTI